MSNSWLDENTIYAATARVACELQIEAELAHADQAMYIRMNMLGRAAQEQRHAAQANREMYDRLSRLIGVA